MQGANAVIKKIDVLRAHMAAQEWRKAVSLAAKFPRLGDEKEVITRAQTAFVNPGFLRQIGKDPESCIEAGKVALIRRYSSSS